jgi:FkbM family methyltransferase
MSPGIKIIQDQKRGQIAVLEVDSHMSRWAEQHESIETDCTVPKYLLPLIPVGGTVIDAGANIGTHTVAYGEKVGKEGHVYAFEPFRLAFECVEFNCRNLPQVRCFNAALGRSSGFAKVNLPNDANMGTATIELAADGVEVVTIDSLPLLRCDFIKIDVEGFELEVLIGAMTTITKFHPICFIELNDATLRRVGLEKKDIMDFMEHHNYRWSAFLDNPLQEPQIDILFTPI